MYSNIHLLKSTRRNNTFQIIYLPMRFKKCTIINLIHDHFDSNFCNIDTLRLIMLLVEWIFHKMFDIGLITVCKIQILLYWLTRILCHCICLTTNLSKKVSRDSCFIIFSLITDHGNAMQHCSFKSMAYERVMANLKVCMACG